MRKVDEREERKPGGSFVMFGGSSDKGQGLMGMGYRLLGIYIVT